jgi:hypothetical protein
MIDPCSTSIVRRARRPQIQIKPLDREQQLPSRPAAGAVVVRSQRDWRLACDRGARVDRTGTAIHTRGDDCRSARERNAGRVEHGDSLPDGAKRGRLDEQEGGGNCDAAGNGAAPKPGIDVTFERSRWKGRHCRLLRAPPSGTGARRGWKRNRLFRSQNQGVQERGKPSCIGSRGHEVRATRLRRGRRKGKNRQEEQYCSRQPDQRSMINPFRHSSVLRSQRRTRSHPRACTNRDMRHEICGLIKNTRGRFPSQGARRFFPRLRKKL